MRLRILDEFSCCNDMAIFKRNYTFVKTQQFINHVIPKQRRNYEVKRFCVETRTSIRLNFDDAINVNDDLL